MLRIAPPSTEQVWIDIANGVRVRCLPASIAIVGIAKAEGRRVYDGLGGGAFEALPLKERIALNYRYAVEVANSLARQVITEWEGVGDVDGIPIAVTPENIVMAMSNPVFFNAFDALYATPAWAPQIEEKKSSSNSADGTSPLAAVKRIVGTAKGRAPNARTSRNAKRRKGAKPGR